MRFPYCWRDCRLTCAGLRAVLDLADVGANARNPQITTACINGDDEWLGWGADSDVGKILKVGIVGERSKDGTSSAL